MNFIIKHFFLSDFLSKLCFETTSFQNVIEGHT